MKDKIGLFLLKKRIKEILPLIEGKFLDIGCGTNELVRSYSGEGIGIDVYPWENADMVVEDTAKLPFDDKSFDTVTIIAAINHIPNRKEVLIEIHRILKDSGKFIFTDVGATTSQIWHFLRRNSDVDQTERGMKEGEIWGFKGTELNDLISKTNFRIIQKSSFNFGINKIYILKKTP